MPGDDRRVALDSGGNRGIGLAVVAGLAQAGMRVVMGSRDPEAGELAHGSLNGGDQRLIRHGPAQ
jgi:NAD(P)-dependent dehydrogenase (short-subunit alcohol dehydrogenase family)